MKKQKRIEEILKELELSLIDLLEPIRMSRTIKEDHFANFYMLLEELEDIMKGEQNISRQLVGMLFFIYTSMVSASKFSQYPDPIFMATATVESYLDKIFWEFPWN